MHRRAVNKQRSAKRFSKASKKTHVKNTKVYRGGFRL